MILIDANILYYCQQNKLIKYEILESVSLSESENKSLENVKDTSLSNLSALFESQDNENKEILDADLVNWIKKIDTKEFENKITAISKMNSKIAIGLSSGHLYFGEKLVIQYDSSVTCLNFTFPFLSLATSSGLIQIYNGSRLIYQHNHTSVVNQIFFKNVIYCHDGNNNLVIITPDKKNPKINEDGHQKKNKSHFNEKKEQFDNLNAPFVFSKYLFISDENILYAKTKNNFSSILNLERPIIDFCFSDNGGILFILEQMKIKIIDFITYNVIKEIGCFSTEDSKIQFKNNSLFFTNKRLNVIKNILSQFELDLKPKEIVLEENKFFINREKEELDVTGEQDNELVELFNTKKENSKIKNRIYSDSDEFEKRPHSDYEENDVLNLESRTIKNRTYIHSDDEENDFINSETKKIKNRPYRDYDELENNFTDSENKIKNKIAKNIVKEGNVELMRYNEHGFVLLKQGSVSLYEVIFHDNSRRGFTVHYNEKSNICDFSKFGLVISTEKKISFYEKGVHKWSKEIDKIIETDGKIKIVRIEKNIHILVENDILDILIEMDLHGQVKSIFDIEPANMVEKKGKYLLILNGNKLSIILNNQFKIVNLIGNVNFLHIEKDEIFYANDIFLYKIFGNISKRIYKLESKRILTIIYENIVILNKLLPSPDVEYVKIEENKDEIAEIMETDDLLLDDEPVSRFSNVPKKIKKFNPLQK